MHGCLLIPKLISRKIPVVRIIITGHSFWQRPPPACTVDYKMTGGCHEEEETSWGWFSDKQFSVFYSSFLNFCQRWKMHIICVNKEDAILFTLHPNMFFLPLDPTTKHLVTNLIQPYFCSMSQWTRSTLDSNIDIFNTMQKVSKTIYFVFVQTEML